MTSTMPRLRLIARLDVKAPNLVKGIQFEGLRKLGDPNRFARKYYEQGIDEIYYEDIVASLYDRNNLRDILENATRDIFIPITVGGGIRSIEDVEGVLNAGADKVAINTAAIKDEKLVSAIAQRFGSQCMVLSIQAKRNDDYWEAYYDNGREKSGKDVIEWTKRAEALGAGEIILTSVDREGTGKGFDTDLIEAVTSEVDIPVIASGGFRGLSDVDSVLVSGRVDGIAIASALHYEWITIEKLHMHCVQNSIPVRTPVSREQGI